jgi:pyrroloquinoline quinone (PQQ) biosynthesis protein C
MEAVNLRTHEAKAHRHADEAEQTALELLERSRKDDEEATVIKTEWDELLQQDAVAHQ